MTSDERATAQRLGHGLPRLLTEDPDRLNDLLGLNRRERRFMASLVPSRVRAAVRERLRNRAEPEKPGEEERLLVQWHYGRPDWRADAWRDALREPGSGPPSLLAIVLAEFIEAEREAAKEAGESPGDRPESDRIADRAWTRTREQLTRWDELEKAEREQCILRTFAVATLRGDVAPLAESVELAADLRDQFENLLPEEKVEEEKERAAASPDAASDEWASRARSLKDLLTRAEGPPPNPDLLTEIAPLVESLRELEPAVRTELSNTAFGEFLSSVRKTLDEIQADPAFWLDSVRRASLEEMWEASRGSLKQEAVGEEKRRFEAAVREASDDVRVAAGDLTAAKERIQSHRAKEPDDPFAQADWGDALADLQQYEHACRRRHRDAQAALLHALSPGGGPADAPRKPPPPQPTPPQPTPPKPTPLKPAPPKPAPPKPAPPKPTPPKPAPPKPAPPKPAPLKPALPKPASPKPAPPKPAPPKPAPPQSRGPRAVKAIIAALLEEPPRLAFAFQVARLCERVFPGDSPPRSRLFEAALLSERLRRPEGAIARRLRDTLADFDAADSGWDEDEVAFQATVRFAASLRPALFAPNTGALSVLNSLPASDVFPAMHTLAQRIAAHAAKVQHAGVQLSLLRTMRTGASLEAARE